MLTRSSVTGRPSAWLACVSTSDFSSGGSASQASSHSSSSSRPASMIVAARSSW